MVGVIINAFMQYKIAKKKLWYQASEWQARDHFKANDADMSKQGEGAATCILSLLQEHFHNAQVISCIPM